ncbi:processive 1,2-diacylglycerol beta-glucosyltransferase [[Eubacterium] yurii]|nr:MAG: galactosyldiacylglycerol synthase [Lachnospiraceae bacterium]SKC41698.1 processive 1,2-diacylglycerol beta-glucosyltransferase [[Eubacterium] yurii]
MKVLILTNKVGGGHNTTANALKKEFEKYDNVECRTIDSFEYISPILQKSVANGYLWSTAIFPGLYKQGYRYQELMDEAPDTDMSDNPAYSFLTQKLLSYFDKEFYPDIVISTHIFSAQLINIMVEKSLIDVKSVGIITDFTIHPHWCKLYSMDYFVTASQLLDYQAIKKGIPKEKILPFGIPIDEKFSNVIEKNFAKKELGLDENKSTILVMSGSMGYGKIDKLVKKIDAMTEEFQIIVVCGNSIKNKKNLEKYKFAHDIYIYGYVDNIDVMMSASELIITKPGGLTSCEVLCKKLPMIMINPIPGQEERNVDFLLNNGCAMYATKTFPIDEAFYQMYINKEKFDNMKKNIDLIRKPNATKDVCEFLVNLNKK